MRKDLSTLNESGMRVRDVGKSALEERCRVVDVALEATLAATEFKGFPLVSEDGTRMLGGYIGRTELMYVLGTRA
jgi:chloride channel 3/4/5